ncbi:TonB-dependent receptor [Marinoscillum furvescens]|uniref:TonB-dependent receptor-like protein n=1 Tax=Marinoscillum furvescens DSM 4134 TaxID=1122208 RepID=A0A3D9L3B6_MARFU|nr:carboxypeptidase-like regulatory domain-containing protein [Marinoscillum furvescens]RED97861.1 TonB-dependent receptor-like protein [Marinoscillum furvescens DSM 4134]
MNRWISLIVLTLSLLFPGYQPLIAQEKDISLEAYFELLEAQYDVHFNYVGSQVGHLKLAPPPDSLTLMEAITFVGANFNLKVEGIENDYFLIHPNITRACGKVVNPQGSPIEGVSVRTEGTFSRTDSSGYFELDLSSADSLITFQHVAYKPRQVRITRQPSPCLPIVLHESITELEAVTVQHYVAPGISKNSNGAIALNLSEIGVLAGMTEADVLHSLQVLPGIQSFNETVSHLNIRGASNDQHNLSWEGIRLYQPGHFFGLITAVNPRITNRVRVIKNGTPARYGGGTSGHILMQAADQQNTSLVAEAGANMLYGDVLLKAPLANDSGLQLAARIGPGNLIATPTYQRYYNRAFNDTEVRAQVRNPDIIQTKEQFTFQDFTAQLFRKINNHNHLSFNSLYIQNELSYQQRQSSNAQDENRESSLAQGSLLLGLSHTYSRKKWSLLSSFHYSEYLLSATNNDVTNSQRLDQENEVLDVGLREEWTYSPNQNWRWVIGGSFQELGVRNYRTINRPEFRSDIKEVMRVLAPYGSVDWTSPTLRTRVYGGLRSSIFLPLNKVVVEPRLSITHALSSKMYVEAKAERKSQHLTQIIDFQDDFLGVEKRKWVLANEENIPLLVSHQVSVGPSVETKNWLLSVEGFYRHINGVASASQGFQNQYERSRVDGETSSYGMEALINPQFETFSGWLNYTWTYNHYFFGDLVPPEFRSNFDIRHLISSGIRIEIDQFTLSTAANWHTGRPYTPLDDAASQEANALVFAVPNSANLPHYFRWDLSAGYQRQWSEHLVGTVGISLWNLTNRTNVVNSYYIYEDSPERIDNQALGFTPNLQLRIAFQ